MKTLTQFILESDNTFVKSKRLEEEYPKLEIYVSNGSMFFWDWTICIDKETDNCYVIDGFSKSGGKNYYRIFICSDEQKEQIKNALQKDNSKMNDFPRIGNATAKRLDNKKLGFSRYTDAIKELYKKILKY